MATISTLNIEGTTGISYAGATRLPYLAEVVIDWAEVLVAKGTALADNDVVEAITVPAGHVILGVGAQVMVAANGTTLTCDIGVTGVDVDEWVDGIDAKATAGTYWTPLAVTPDQTMISTADTIDVLLLTLTGTVSTGKLRVFAWLLDVSAKAAPGLVAIGS